MDFLSVHLVLEAAMLISIHPLNVPLNPPGPVRGSEALVEVREDWLDGLA